LISTDWHGADPARQCAFFVHGFAKSSRENLRRTELSAVRALADEMCLTPVEEMAPEDIRTLRIRENASQAVFVRHLNVTTGLVSQWERGEKRPRGASLKLLALVAKNGLDAVA